MNTKDKIIVAMSGGVDSSVTAALLAREGHDVVGVTLRLLPKGGQGFGCCGSPEDLTIAKRSAEKAGVPHYVLDYSIDFEKDVINYFVDSYLDGETPNPCMACNKHIKFDKLETFSQSLNAKALATGHYGRIIKKNDAYHLYEAVDDTKDQSYVLFNANQASLATTLLPLGGKTKKEIRALAHELGLPNADKKDSQEICFVPNRDYTWFVKDQLKERNDTPLTAQPGKIKDSSGKVVGEHKGVAFYTVGQRKGLGVAGNTPLYVNKLDAKTNTLVVGPDSEGFASGLTTKDMTWTQDIPPQKDFKALVKIRYKHTPAPAHIHVKENSFEVEFETPQRAITPGQSAVIYQWDETLNAREVLGGGVIKTSEN